MAKRWHIRPHDSALVASLETTAGVSPVVAQLLVQRGVVNGDDARSFLEAKLADLREPALLPGVTEATERIHHAIAAKRRIVIYGDYDADGMTATSILITCLKLLGADVGYYLPNRLEDGYGLNDDALRKLAERGASLVISVDCGIASVQQAETAREAGLELIVTDHHEFGETLPNAAALVHPRLPGTNYPFGGLCGAGVAFKLAWSLCQRASDTQKVSPPMREFLLKAMGFAAIGTVADVVPLIDENRILVRHGLSSLQFRATLGIEALKRITKLDKKPSLSSEDIAFSIGPHLNAAGRLGQAQLGVELLTTESEERAGALAEYIHELNSSRDSLERSIYLAANKQAQEQFDPESDSALVLSGSGWHAGVIGIVAGRIAEKYHRPTVVISLDAVGAKPGIGSARSACGLKLHEAFAACGDHLLSHGGHAAAAGLKVAESEVESFRAAFCEYAASEIKADDRVPTVNIDAEAPLSQLTLQTVQQMEQLAPFGQANRRPLLCAAGVTLSGKPKRMGGGERHLALTLAHHQVKLRAVGFGRGDWVDELPSDEPFDVAYHPVINEYAGRRSVELHLVDWRVAKSPVAV